MTVEHFDFGFTPRNSGQTVLSAIISAESLSHCINGLRPALFFIFS